jgi:surface protein
MSTITDKIKSLSNIKKAIKDKLSGLGLNPSNNFASYSSLISSIKFSLAHLFDYSNYTSTDTSYYPTEISISSSFTSSGNTSLDHTFAQNNTSGAVLTSIVFPSNWNTVSCTTAAGCFDNCTALSSLDLSSWDTSNIVDYSFMFHSNTSLTTITGLDKFDMSKGYNLGAMFSGCNNLVFPDLTAWSLINAGSIDSMFSACKKLTSFCNESTMHPAATGSIFAYCNNLEKVNLPYLSMDGIAYGPWGIFYQCFKLHTIILGEAFGRAATSMTLDLSQTGTMATDDTVIGTGYSPYTFSDDTWTSFLNLYDRSDFTDSFTIKFHPNHKSNYTNWDTFVDQMTARGYNITTA